VAEHVGGGGRPRPLACTLALLITLWLLVGCAGESSNAPEERSTVSGTGSGNNPEEETTVAETTTAVELNPTRLTELGGTVRPVFSPDGRKIAFFNYPGGMEVRDGEVVPPPGTFPDLRIMDADGGNSIRLAEQALPSDAVFSPDGRKVAFARYNDRNAVHEITGMNGAVRMVEPPPEPPEVYVVDTDGTGPTNLTNNPATDADPIWSPDGRK
jgi:Tol biopolymer transport system component